MSEPFVDTFEEQEQGWAGRFLEKYENDHYTVVEKLAKISDPWPGLQRVVYPSQQIVVPAGAEQLCDVSFYQGLVDWGFYASKLRGAILRIGQGIWVDSQFARNYQECRAHGILIGGYWFYDDRYSPQQQLGVLLDALAGGKYFDLEIYIDWERSYGGNYSGIKNVVSLMKLLQNSGVRCYAVGLYTGYYYFTDNTNPITNDPEYVYLKNQPLWIAWYAAAVYVKLPAPWTTWRLWQSGTPVIDVGQETKEIDWNNSVYTSTEFINIYSNDGGNMINPTHTATVRSNATPWLNVRSDDGYPYATKIGEAYPGDRMDCVISMEGWIEFDTIQRAAGGLAQLHGFCAIYNPSNPTTVWIDLVPIEQPGGPGFPDQMNVTFDYPDPAGGSVVYKGTVNRQ